MKLKNTVTLTFNDNSSLVLTTIDPVWVDDMAHKVLLAKLHPSMKFLVLWRGDQYDELGDWTQAQAENRVIELLGDDHQTTLQNLLLS